MRQGDRPRTAYAMATEISRELGLNLHGGQVEDLARLLDGMADPEAGAAEVLAGGRKRAREALAEVRARAA